MSDYMKREDTISRQSALDWLKNKWNGMVTSLFDGIKALPSAQTEITRCNECAKRRTLDCPMGITVFDAPPSDGYCYKAERRNDG